MLLHTIKNHEGLKVQSMDTRELDVALMQQITIESVLKPSGDAFKLQLSSDFNIAALQEQAYDYCLKSKSFLYSHHVDADTVDGKFNLFMKLHMTRYKDNGLCTQNQAMKHLYNKTKNN